MLLPQLNLEFATWAFAIEPWGQSGNYPAMKRSFDDIPASLSLSLVGHWEFG